MLSHSRRSLLSAISLALFFCACANVKGSTTLIPGTKNPVAQHGLGLPATAVTQSALQGSWKTACTKDTVTGDYYTSKITFQNGVMKTDTFSYADQSCDYAITEEIRTSNFTTTTISGISTLTENLVTLEYIPLNTVIANALNQNNFCGTKTWQSNSPETFTDASVCSGIVNNLLYQIELYGNSQDLYLDGCSTSPTTSTPSQSSCSVLFTSNS